LAASALSLAGVVDRKVINFAAVHARRVVKSNRHHRHLVQIVGGGQLRVGEEGLSIGGDFRGRGVSAHLLRYLEELSAFGIVDFEEGIGDIYARLLPIPAFLRSPRHPCVAAL